MATTKKSGKKGGGAAKKGGGKKSSKKGGSLSSVLSNIGTVAGTVGSIAGSLGGGRKGELRVAAPSGANINDLVTALKKKFREAGCPMCRSGIDRIVFEDIVAGGGGIR